VKLILSVSNDDDTKVLGLIRAVQDGYVESANIFIAHGVKLPSDYYNSLYAAYQPNATQELRNGLVVSALIDKYYGAANKLIDLGARIIFGKDITYHILLGMISNMEVTEDRIVFKTLSRAGIDIDNHKDDLLKSLLSTDLNKVRLAIIHLVSLGAKVEDKQQLLHKFLSINRLEHYQSINNNIKELSANGIDFDQYKNDLLVSMCLETNSISVRYLLNRRADIHYQKDLPLQTLMQTITSEYNSEKEIILGILLKFGACPKGHLGDEEPLIIAIRNQNKRIINILIDNQANPNGNNGLPFLTAIDTYHFDTICHLIDLGANIHIRDEEPLRRAILADRFDIVKLLLMKDADIHTRNDEFFSLMTSTMYNFVDNLGFRPNT
jgi:ankyrin repeat protein